MEDMIIPIDVLSSLKNVIMMDDATTFGIIFAEANGPATVLKAMRRWQDCDNIQSLACYVLANTGEMHEAAGVEPILSAINLFKTTTESDEGLVWKLSFALKALCNIINRNFEGAIAFQNASGFASVVDVLQEPFPNAPLSLKARLHVTLAQAMLFCVGTLLNHNADTSTLFSEMIDSGVITSLLWSMQQFPDNARIQRLGCAILLTLGMNTQGIIRIINDGGKQVLETAKTLHANERAVQEGASELLEGIKGMDNINHCHTCLASSEDLMQCSRCKKIFYCDRKCQRKDYKLHKKICMQMSMKSRANGDIE